MDYRDQCSCEPFREEGAPVLLQKARDRLPALRRVLSEHGSTPLRCYGRSLDWSGEAFQPREDLLSVLAARAASLFGAETGRLLALDLDRCPLILTTNHLGVDFSAQSIQGNLLLGLFRRRKALRTVPVLSVGSVSLNNVTYPRGMLFYRIGRPQPIPQRVPLFPDRWKRSMAGSVPGMDRAMIESARETVGKRIREKSLSPGTGAVGLALLSDEYLAVCDGSWTYADQAALLNARIWKKLFGGGAGMPALVSLEFEQVAADLLALDLCNPGSLVSMVFFQKPVRERLMAELDGVRGCWTAKGIRPHVSPGRGTVFFWGVDTKGRRVPLGLDDCSPGRERLCGRDDSGGVRQMDFQPQALLEGLHRGWLKPSLLTCFLVVAFARGMACVGGYFQASYLSLIQRGVGNALSVAAPHGGGPVERIMKVPSSLYLSGMIPVMCTDEAGEGMIPAGPLEILTEGGLSEKDLETVEAVTVEDAHLAGLFETVPDVCTGLSPGWQVRLAAECRRLLEGRVVLAGGGAQERSDSLISVSNTP